MINDHRYYYPRLNVVVLVALSMGLGATAAVSGIGLAKLAVLL